MVGEWLEQMIRATAWTMEKPRAYGPFHLIFTFVGLLLAFLIARSLRRTGKWGNRIVLVGTGVFLILTEVYKQLFYYYHIGDGSYQWWIFPFQLCSVPMYLCVIAPWLKDGPVQRGMYAFMTTFNLLGGIMAFIEPSGIVHEYWTLTLHAFIWHMCLIFIGVYLILSGRFAQTKRDYWLACATFVALCTIAFGINVALGPISDWSINMFFVGPKNSSLIVFKQISEMLGWYVSTLLYIPTVCIGALTIFIPLYYYGKKRYIFSLAKR